MTTQVTTGVIADGAVTAAKLASDVGGLTLLGTLTTTSGSTATLSGLTLTTYRALYVVFNAISASAAFTPSVNTTGTANSGALLSSGSSGSNTVMSGFVMIDLATGVADSTVMNDVPTNLSTVVTTTLRTTSTSVTFTSSAGSWDAGSITVYGMK